MRRTAVMACSSLLCAACAGVGARGPERVSPRVSDATTSERDSAVARAPHFWFDARLPLGHPVVDSLRNANGSARVTDPTSYVSFWRAMAPSLSSWAADERLHLNPNYVAALIAKESGFDSLAISAAPAYGIAQLTRGADVDLILIGRDSPRWQWIHDEVRRWPRHPALHVSVSGRVAAESLLASASISSRSEYLFDPVLAVRAAMFWLRVLAETWTEDRWPGRYGTLARARLAGGRALDEDDLLALVTVSYDQGDSYVADLVQRRGREWQSYLNDESADYLERIRAYTVLFQLAGSR